MCLCVSACWRPSSDYNRFHLDLRKSRLVDIYIRPLCYMKSYKQNDSRGQTSAYILIVFVYKPKTNLQRNLLIVLYTYFKPNTTCRNSHNGSKFNAQDTCRSYGLDQLFRQGKISERY